MSFWSEGNMFHEMSGEQDDAVERHVEKGNFACITQCSQENEGPVKVINGAANVLSWIGFVTWPKKTTQIRMAFNLICK